MKVIVLITVICLVTHEKIADGRIVNTDGIRTSWSVFDDEVGLQLRKSLKANIEQVVIELNATAKNATHEDEGLDIVNAEGVDVYIVVDVSKSIDESKYNKTKEFLKALLPNLGITNRTYGTRIALHYFALTYASMFNSVFALAFSNYREAQSAIDEVNIETISREENGSANASCMALEDVMTTIETLQFVHYYSRKLVIIIISDGKFTRRCNAKKFTDYVKDEKLAEIYSIAFGTIQDAETGFQSMKDLASDIDGEKLFFKINAAEKDLKHTIDFMINPSAYYSYDYIDLLKWRNLHVQSLRLFSILRHTCPVEYGPPPCRINQSIRNTELCQFKSKNPWKQCRLGSTHSEKEVQVATL